MSTFLLTWNPKYYAWDDPFEGMDALKYIMAQCGTAIMSWSSGPSRKIKKGDRVFIIRLGVEPKGMVASGHALSDVFELQHWDPEKSGERRKYIYIGFDKILNPEYDDILPLQVLRGLAPTMHWTPICSGIHIPDEIIEVLESVWATY